MVVRRVKTGFLAVLFAWLALAAAALPAPAAERSVEIWVGESVSIAAGRKQIEPNTVEVSSDNKKVATATWGKADTGPVTITGVSVGKTIVTVKGEFRVIPVGIKGKGEKAAILQREPFTDYVDVTVIEAEVKLSKMSAKDRKKAEEIVQEDLKDIVASTSFIAKKHSKVEK
jgi:hypothetical protein